MLAVLEQEADRLSRAASVSACCPLLNRGKPGIHSQDPFTEPGVHSQDPFTEIRE
jgi:hypothetical protein